jgi:hypothetical protein
VAPVFAGFVLTEILQFLLNLTFYACLHNKKPPAPL